MVKAQGLSINTVILIALGVLVLIILAFVVGGKFKDLGTTTSQCDGRCVVDKGDCSPDIPIPMSSCVEDGQKIDGAQWCCKPL
ncbi:hypothetical protein HY483_00010 [Candidatus Woesearchaeota archaeon]|nr:hypothetical protein [Candidatus Woesearchaeota archaeon]